MSRWRSPKGSARSHRNIVRGYLSFPPPCRLGCVHPKGPGGKAMVPVLVIDRDRDHLADSARVLASHGPLAARADSEALRRGHVALDVAAIVRQPFAPGL